MRPDKIHSLQEWSFCSTLFPSNEASQIFSVSPLPNYIRVKKASPPIIIWPEKNVSVESSSKEQG